MEQSHYDIFGNRLSSLCRTKLTLIGPFRLGQLNSVFILTILKYYSRIRNVRAVKPQFSVL